jgi:hypothetical protein
MIEQQVVIFAFNMSIVVVITVLSFETDRHVLPALRALQVKV